MSVSVPRSRFADRQEVLRAQLCATTETLSERLRELGIGATAREFAPD